MSALVAIGCCTLSCASEKFRSNPDADGGASSKRVFVTSIGYSADLGGPAGADALCTQHAENLGGTWKAWISVETEPAAARLSAWNGPYRLVSDARIADSWEDLSDGSLDTAINLDENGTPPPALARTWTGTRADGSWSGADCAGWTSGFDALVGIAGSIVTDAKWTDGDALICNLPAHLYCIEQ